MSTNTTATVASRLRRPLQVLFVVTLVAFLAIGSALLIAQVVGAVFVNPSLVSGASDALLVPAIAAAVVFGLVSFAAGYTQSTGTDDSESS